MNTKYRGCQAQRDEVEGEEMDCTEDEILSVKAQQRLNFTKFFSIHAIVELITRKQNSLRKAAAIKILFVVKLFGIKVPQIWRVLGFLSFSYPRRQET